MADSDLQSWWNGLPVVTKWLFASSFGTTVAAHFGLLPWQYLILIFEEVFYKFQIWRLVSAFIWHGPITKATGFAFLINMVFLVRYASALEKHDFAGRTADFLFMVLFGALNLLGIQAFLTFFMPSWAPLPLLGPALIVMLIYYWSKITPNVTMTFLLGIQFKSQWFPWVLVAFTVLTGGDPRMELMGIAAGHIYFFLNDMYPRIYGRTLISTPQFIKGWFPQAPRPGAGPADQGPRMRYNWGAGQRLGN
eukprot:TRINITY_DN13487_c0_g1_i1.p1 TRINITY_DN13487_c0_g1~~TRINITY_DN13487_c0_g1_i1.p1  ORF type:complete len:250 (-),score=17.83 TRINITY_DN13487_c0_g1_i1:36-785(-)